MCSKIKFYERVGKPALFSCPEGGGHLYPVSDAFLLAVKQNTRRYYWTGRITAKVGTVRRRKNKKTGDFKDYMVRRIDEKVDVSVLEAEREQIREQLRQVMGAKKKLTEML